MNNNTDFNQESRDAAISIAMLIFGLLGIFFLCLNPNDSATLGQFFIGLIASKAAMLVCLAIAAKCYRKLYC